MKATVVAIALGLTGALASGAETSDAAERTRIGEERVQAQRLFVERERNCQAKFVVTSCLDEARRERRETLERLRHQELVLENAVRKQRAAARSAQIREKQTAKETQPNPMVVRERQAEPARQPAGRATTPSSARRASSAPAQAPISAEQESKNKAAFEAKQREASAHRAEVERRNAEKANKSKPAAPLPVPKAASGQ